MSVLSTHIRNLQQQRRIAAIAKEKAKARAASLEPTPQYGVYASPKFLPNAGWLRKSTPAEVRRDGYGFTTNPDEVWTFDSQKQAKAKARVLDRHFDAFGAFSALPYEEIHA